MEERYHVTNIEYDFDESVSPEERNAVPKEMVVFCESEDEIADAISDETGWLVKSFSLD